MIKQIRCALLLSMTPMIYSTPALEKMQGALDVLKSSSQAAPMTNVSQPVPQTQDMSISQQGMPIEPALCVLIYVGLRGCEKLGNWLWNSYYGSPKQSITNALQGLTQQQMETYVDNKITAAADVSKKYVDGQITAVKQEITQTTKELVTTTYGTVGTTLIGYVDEKVKLLDKSIESNKAGLASIQEAHEKQKGILNGMEVRLAALEKGGTRSTLPTAAALVSAASSSSNLPTDQIPRTSSSAPSSTTSSPSTKGHRRNVFDKISAMTLSTLGNSSSSNQNQTQEDDKKE